MWSGASGLPQPTQQLESRPDGDDLPVPWNVMDLPDSVLDQIVECLADIDAAKLSATCQRTRQLCAYGWEQRVHRRWTHWDPTRWPASTLDQPKWSDVYVQRHQVRGTFSIAPPHAQSSLAPTNLVTCHQHACVIAHAHAQPSSADATCRSRQH